MTNDELLKERVSSIIEHLNKGMREREEAIAVSLLAALAHQNTFLLGPPGTAKSLIARRLSCAFSDEKYFEYLMQRFSTPEDIFGPVSIAELKKDNYIRKTEGYLPEASFAFLDEIWKSGPAILNALLTIINEKLFRNGMEIKKVPLKALIVASNETPPDNQGLDALYDRFLVRLNVLPLQDNKCFEFLLKSAPEKTGVEIPSSLIIKNEEWNEWHRKIQSVRLSRETINIVNLIKLSLAKIKKKPGVYVSDRRWQRAMILIKAAAFFCDRKETNLVDTLLLRHCLWTTKGNREEIVKIIERVVRESGFVTELSFDVVVKEKDNLEKEIMEELYYRDDIYRTTTLDDDKKYFENTIKVMPQHYHRNEEEITYYVSLDKMGSTDQFHPVDESGNEMKNFTCCFKGAGSYSTESRNHEILDRDGRRTNSIKKSPKVLFHKGDKKENVNARLVKSLRSGVTKNKGNLQKILEKVGKERVSFLKEQDTPFVPLQTRNIASESVDKQLEELKIAIQDCKRLYNLIGD